jgi:hypothetical protein
MSKIRFTVREDDKEFSVSHMTEPEQAAIQECVEDLLPKLPEYLWWQVETCLVDEEDMLEVEAEYPEQDQPYGLIKCRKINPNPRNGSMAEESIPAKIPEPALQALQGKTFRVRPRQLGLSPWGAKVEIVFEAPKAKPMLASELIQRALSQQAGAV